MKKILNLKYQILNIVIVCFLIILAIPAVIPLFKDEFYSSHDGVTHVVRFLKFDQVLREGQIPPRWADGVAFNLGSPVLMFNAPLPYTVAEIPKILGANYSFSLEIIFAISFILSGIFFYFWAQEVFGKTAGFIGACVYIYAPYRFVDLYVRGAFPENFAFIFPPLMLLAAKKMVDNFQLKWFLIGVGSLSGIILSHNVMAILFSAIFIIYGLILSLEASDIKKFKLVMLTFIVSLLLTSFYWIPSFFEKSYTHLDRLNASRSYDANFATFDKIIYSKWMWGPLRSDSPMSPQIGITQLTAIALSIIFFVIFRKKINKFSKLHFFLFLTLLYLGVFLMTKLSLVFWENFNLLSFFLYPWRFLALIVFSAAVLASFSISAWRSKILIVIFIFLLLYANRNHTQLVGKVTDDDSFYQGYTDTTDMWGEFLPIGADLDLVYQCKQSKCYFQKLETPSDVIVKTMEQKNNYYFFEYSSDKNFSVTLNTYYFPGWEVYVDGKKIEAMVNKVGSMDIRLPRGNHKLEAKFINTPLRNYSNLTSIISLISLIGFLKWKRN